MTLRLKGNTTDVMGALQPLRTHEREISGAGGFGIGERYTLYLPYKEELPIQNGTEVLTGTRQFVVERWDVYTVQGQPLYYKARLLRLKTADGR